MPTVLLVRHGRTAANSAGILAGRTPGVRLDDAGRAAATALAARLSSVPMAAIVSSPLERCVETAALLAAGRDGPAVEVDERLIECDYGEWTARPLSDLRRDRLWKVVQTHPSAMTFPGGESMRDAQARAVAAVREHDARIATAAGPDAVWVAVTHGDLIASTVADAVGLHLDLFQRLVVDPCSVTVVRYTDLRPFVVRLNDTGSDLSWLRPRRGRRRRPATDAVVGGGGGTS